MFVKLALFSYIVDRIFGEFSSVRHPVVFMGDFIKWYENYFYKDNIFRGVLLTLSLLLSVVFTVFMLDALLSYFLNDWLYFIALVLLGSTTIASKMLYDSVADIMLNPQNIKYLVSRDTKQLTNSDTNKAAIETYSENLSDGVVAPLLYLLFFGLYGAFIYKAINTLDSMVGYKNNRYINFGKFSAKLDDVANFIPSRVTAVLIAILFRSKKAFMEFYKQGRRHKSPNAGHPIASMALAIGVKLGGDTSYFGKVESKPFFGDGKENIESKDIKKALSLQIYLDILTIVVLGILQYFVDM